MKISKRTYYGLRAVVSLADADGPVSAHELAEQERIPEEFLEKILQTLRKAGIVESKQGAEGGYAIARREASVWDILRVLDGPVRTFTPPQEKGMLPCDFPSHCRTNAVLRHVEDAVKRTLSEMTIRRMTSDKAQYSNNKLQTKHKSQTAKRNGE